MIQLIHRHIVDMVREGLLQMEIKIMEWNIHQKGRTGKEIPLWILSEISEDINILILTEFNNKAGNINEFYQKIESMGFVCCETEYSYKYANDILIAVRGEEIVIKSVSYFKAYPDGMNNDSYIQWEHIPENLKVDIAVNNKPVTILGIRIKELSSDYNLRKIQMETLMKWVEEIANPIIISGDFNNLRVDTTEQEWNLNVLDGLLGEKFIRKTPFNHSWGLKRSKNGLLDGYIKNDHIICKDISKFTVGDYDWSFVSKRNYQFDNKYSYGCQNAIDIVGSPDHGILFASVKL